jgi:hypothetical protein
VQGELLDLAAALDNAALVECAGLVPTFLSAVREFRKHLRQHVSAVETPPGVYDHLAFNAPSLGSDIAALAQEHQGLEKYLAKLERDLDGFDPTDAAATEALQQHAHGLAELTHCHQRRGCMLARRAGDNAKANCRK